MKTIASSLAVLAVALLAGCDAGEISTARAAVPGAAPHLLPLDPGALRGHSLGGSSLAELQLLATAHGRDVLAQVVSCALPRGASLTTINRDGTPYSFAGNLGLAPGWAQRPATRLEHQRVTVCLRLHGLGTLRA